MFVAGRENVSNRLKKLKAEDDFFQFTNYGKEVLAGPFKGMKYPTLVSNCSQVAPKIIGSYESELDSILETICKDPNYAKVLDIGCAEGYYAIGLLRRMPKVSMYAYDIDAMSRQFCMDMAKTNGVDNRLIMGEFCSPETLQNFDFNKKSLIVCDCEGYEIELFNSSNVKNLHNCDLLIELHDLFNPAITPTLTSIFKDTHTITLITSEYKDSSNYPILSSFEKSYADLIISESREGEMQWAFLQSKLHTN